MQEETNIFPNYKHIPKTGVIYVMDKATKMGFSYGNEEWSNLGQGAPETGEINSVKRHITEIEVDPVTSEYAPVAGTMELRQAVADLYNKRYRNSKASKYSYENVAISAGGRVALSRLAASLGNIHLGHFLPDYTAYEEIFEVFKGFIPIPIVLEANDEFRLSPETLQKEIIGRGLGAILLSNPSNPTGQVLYGKRLKEVVDVAKTYNCSMIFDEFYSHYIYRDDLAHGTSISAARHVEDVDKDSIIIIDGLTKNWRYPGLRLSWTLGPKEIISKISSVGSFLDGGASHAIQKASIPLLSESIASKETEIIQDSFRQKRDFLLRELSALEFEIPCQPQGSFYIFANLSNLPQTLQNGMDFFEACLKEKVICVPGSFFDVNPGKRRSHIKSRLTNFVRFSFGPSMAELELGVEKIKRVIKDHSE